MIESYKCYTYKDKSFYPDIRTPRFYAYKDTFIMIPCQAVIIRTCMAKMSQTLPNNRLEVLFISYLTSAVRWINVSRMISNIRTFPYWRKNVFLE